MSKESVPHRPQSVQDYNIIRPISYEEQVQFFLEDTRTGKVVTRLQRPWDDAINPLMITHNEAVGYGLNIKPNFNVQKLHKGAVAGYNKMVPSSEHVNLKNTKFSCGIFFGVMAVVSGSIKSAYAKKMGDNGELLAAEGPIGPGILANGSLPLTMDWVDFGEHASCVKEKFPQIGSLTDIHFRRPEDDKCYMTFELKSGMEGQAILIDYGASYFSKHCDFVFLDKVGNPMSGLQLKLPKLGELLLNIATLSFDDGMGRKEQKEKVGQSFNDYRTLYNNYYCFHMDALLKGFEMAGNPAQETQKNFVEGNLLALGKGRTFTEKEIILQQLFILAKLPDTDSSLRQEIREAYQAAKAVLKNKPSPTASVAGISMLSQASARALAKGDVVCLVGLSQEKFNGQQAVVKKYISAGKSAGRYRVQLEGSGKQFAVKPVNIRCSVQPNP